MATHCVTTNGTHVVMTAEFRARQAFQDHSESAGRDIKAAWLEPNALCIRHPKTVIIEVDVGYEMSSASLFRFKAVRETVECSDGHMFSSGSVRLDTRMVPIRTSN